MIRDVAGYRLAACSPPLTCGGSLQPDRTSLQCLSYIHASYVDCFVLQGRLWAIGAENLDMVAVTLKTAVPNAAFSLLFTPPPGASTVSTIPTVSTI